MSERGERGEHASFDLTDPIVFTAGTVGPPGQRVFFLQAQGDGLVVTLKCEKQQVGALADYFAGLLADLPTVDPGEVPTLLDLVEPVVPEWAVGTLAVAWDEENDRMVRAAKNQSLFREINERIETLNEAFGDVLPTAEWVCECAADSCFERMVIPLEDYQRILGSTGLQQTVARFAADYQRLGTALAPVS